jgi:hypothetical protein
MASASDRGKARQLREEELAEAIVGYLAEHPRAMDTLQGIAEWWIPHQRVRVDVETIERVLRNLTEKGLLERLQTLESCLYRLKGKKFECPPDQTA